MPVVFIVALVFIGVPLLEIYLLIQVGSAIGAGYTIALVIGTAILGAVLLRAQSINTLLRARTQLRQGQLPAIEVAEGLLLVFCGALLLTPGFFTDGVGFALLMPPLRRALICRVMARVNVAGATDAAAPTIIEGEYRHTDSNK